MDFVLDLTMHLADFTAWTDSQSSKCPGFEINGCPVVPDNQNYDGATKLC